MEISSFAEDVKESVKEKLGKGYHVKVCRVDKNNGVTYTGLCVTNDDASVSPVIYIDSCYDTYKKGDTTLADAADYVADICRIKRPKVDMRYFLNYESVKGSIVYKLINTDKNRELLADLPHMEFLDLSIVFQCVVENKEIGTATILIHNAHLKLWGVSVEELYKEAVKNTPRLREYELKNMKEMLSEAMQEKVSGESIDRDDYMGGLEYSIPMYVLSNRRRIDGAACILYPFLLRDFSKTIGGSFYIIPSSVHEVLLLPTDNTDNCGEIREMIREVNDTQVMEEEILSYSLYYYDAEVDEVRVCV